jgi:hypothetical protein
MAAMTARLLVPTESAAIGDTLWIVVLLLLAATIHTVGRWQAGHRLQLDGFSVAITVIVVGHLVSGVWIVATEGHKRWAVNIMWEWVSLGAMCLVLRRSKAALTVATTMLVVLAGHGIWQYAVDFPALRAEYAGHVSGDGSALDRIRHQRELSLQGIPESESVRKLFADRLASLEPLGPFALANTLGGLLAVALLLGGASLLESKRSIGQYVVGVLVLVPVAYCLFLTKSRTAFVAVLAGFALFGFRRFLNRNKPAEPQPATSGHGRLIATGLIVLTAAIIVAAVATGGLDEQVISESPKSLQYRLMYWQGTINTLRESPLLGTGPGNFRQNYTAHKLPASSEEILDPHNMFLDAWCNGGVIALLGLLILVGLSLRGCLMRHPEEPQPNRTGGLLAGLCGFGFVLLQQWLTGQERVALTLNLAGGFAVAWFAVRYALVPTRHAMAIGSIGLMIHLLGAGGFEMPAVMQLTLLLVAATGKTETPATVSRHWRGLIPVPLGVVAIVACLITAAVPVTRVAFLLSRGDMNQGTAALKDYSDAEVIDKLSPEPARRFAKAVHAGGDQRYRGIVLAALMKARGKDPKSFVDHLALGILLRDSADDDEDTESTELRLKSATQHLARAVNRYPTNPQIVGELAIAHEMAGQTEPARKQADRALQLDAINRQNGHIDRYLPEEFLNQLKSLSRRKSKEQAAAASAQSQKRNLA